MLGLEQSAWQLARAVSGYLKTKKGRTDFQVAPIAEIIVQTLEPDVSSITVLSDTSICPTVWRRIKGYLKILVAVFQVAYLFFGR